MDIPNLGERAAYYFAQGIADSSLRTYHSGEIRYLKYCGRQDFPPLPLTEHGLCGFVAHLADENLKHRTVKTYLSGLRYYQIKAGLPDPFQGAMPRLSYVLKGVKSNEAKRGGGSRERLPITPSILRKLREVWLPIASDPDTKLIWAACCLCFFAFLRAGELTVPSDGSYDPVVHLSFSDLAVDNLQKPSSLRNTIKQSKTDPFRRGVNLWVGRTGSDLCPVAAVLDYLRVRGSRPGPLFVFVDRRVLSRQRFVDAVCSALEKAGFDQAKYCSHSFRIGAASAAAAKGIEDCVIKTLGRWESLAYLQYIRLPREQLAGFSGLLASP